MNPLLVVNPAAGGGRAGRTLEAIRLIVERALGPVDLALTEKPGHAIVLARAAAAEKRALVIAVGGDGTLHEVANGILDVQPGPEGATALGMIAEGTGGDFRKSLGLEHRLDRYVEAIASGRERQVDAARATFRGSDGHEQTRWFVNILSVGLGGLVDRFVVDAPRALTSSLAYAWASLRALAASDSVPLQCRVERGGRSSDHLIDAWTLALCNGTTFGAGMRVAPMAGLDDGRLELVALGAPTKLAFVSLSRRLFGGSHIGETGVTHLAGERFTIALAAGAPPRPVFLDIDGEPLGELPLRVEIVPGALRLRA